jgi:hypothetical protein
MLMIPGYSQSMVAISEKQLPLSGHGKDARAGPRVARLPGFMVLRRACASNSVARNGPILAARSLII